MGYAPVTLRKVEADELRPSGQMAKKLAETLELTPEEQAQFVRFARDEVLLGRPHAARPCCVTADSLYTPAAAGGFSPGRPAGTAGHGCCCAVQAKTQPAGAYHGAVW